jgi:hypothetical protein
VRARLVSERTATVNEIRAFLLDRGIAVAQGIQRLRHALPNILGTHQRKLSPRMVAWIEAAAKRLPPQQASHALANKLARIAWAMLRYGRNFEVRTSHDDAPQHA